MSYHFIALFLDYFRPSCLEKWACIILKCSSLCSFSIMQRMIIMYLVGKRIISIIKMSKNQLLSSKTINLTIFWLQNQVDRFKTYRNVTDKPRLKIHHPTVTIVTSTEFLPALYHLYLPSAALLRLRLSDPCERASPLTSA